MLKALSTLILVFSLLMVPAVSHSAADVINIDGDEDAVIETFTILVDQPASYSCTVAKTPSHGTLSEFTQPNNIKYRPYANYNGTDSFSVKIHIVYEDPDVPPEDWVGVYNVTVQSVNDYPVAHPLSVSTFKGTAVSLQLSGTDPVEGSSLTYAAWTPPVHGALSDVSHGPVVEWTDQTIVYTPEPGFVGNDSFSYVVFDGTDFSYEALARITVTESRELIVSVSGTGSGNVNSDPPAIFCVTGSGSSAGCSAGFTQGSTVKLIQIPSYNSLFGGWSGACSGTGSCEVVMDTARNVSAAFTVKPATVRIDGSASSYYDIGSTLDLISTGGRTVRAKAEGFAENVIMTSPVAILLKGGFTDDAFSSRSATSLTVLDGSLKIRQGLLRIERLAVR